MAHNILLDNKMNNNILKSIENLHINSNELEKNKISLLNNSTETELLNSILQSLTSTIHDIKNQYNKEQFTINDIIDFINQHYSNLNINISTSNSFAEIENNKLLIEATVLLLALMQIDENRVDRANINLNMDSNDNLIVEMADYLECNANQKDILFTKKSHKFDDKDKKFYGLYLFLIETIAKKLDAIVNVDGSRANMYKIKISIPVTRSSAEVIKLDSVKNSETKTVEDIKTETSPEYILSMLDKKVAIYQVSKYFSHKIEGFLEESSLDVEIVPYEKEELPNFTNYNLLIIDTRLVEKKLADHIFTLRLISDLKVIFINESGHIGPEYINLADKILGKNLSKEELALSISKLFDKEELKPIKSKKSTAKNEHKISNKKRVIIADGNTTNLKLLEYIIKEHDFDVLSTKNGKEAIELLEKYGANLVIIDNNLEELNGYEVVKLIRADNRYKHTPIAIHSSFSMDNQSIGNIFLAGFDSYLPKPFKKEDIETLLNRYLKTNKKVASKDEIKEFLALYQDVDILIEKYANSKQISQLESLLSNLKQELNKLNNQELVADIDKILVTTSRSNLDTILIKEFINKYQSYIFSLTN